MKNKFFIYYRKLLLGIGIGLIISSITLLTFNNQSYQLTDEEIIKRAEQMGMGPVGEYEEQINELENRLKEKQIVNYDDYEAKYVQVYIAPGSTTATISNKLEDYGVIDNSEEFTELIHVFDLQRKLIAGHYEFEVDSDMATVLYKLISINNR